MIVNKEGVKGLYRGVSTTFAGIYFILLFD